MYSCEFFFWDDFKVESRNGVIYAGDSEGVIFEESNKKSAYVACPAFVNYHTHLGDSVAKDPPFSGIELVMPKGYKFRVLKEYEDNIVQAMEKAIKHMILSGVLKAFDFREGGISGIKALRSADKAGICVALGRPEENELEELLKVSDGFGISSVRDVGFEKASEMREFAKKRKKLFFVHAGEVDSKDVDQAVELRPDAIVHMNMAEIKQIKRAMDERIKIVSCIRSNMFFDVARIENYRFLKEYEGWRIGTDNVMLSSPSMLEEMHFASYVTRDVENVFRAATCEGMKYGVVIFHKRLNFSNSNNALATLVRRAGMEDIECVIPGEVKIE